ncbi:MAG: sulfurtransferase [Chloroflexi bacterium]|nr:sulfurtransferase [Chloroflexota bacterium]
MSENHGPALLTTFLVAPEWLADHLDSPDVRIFDVRLAEAYADGHIPNALHVDLNQLRGERDGIEAMLLPPEAFAEAAGRLGIDAQTTAILYDDHHGMPASRAAWSLLRYGHTRVALLDGGWDAWESRALPVETEPATPSASEFKVTLMDGFEADYAWIRAHLQTPDVVLLDVRSPLEHNNGSLPDAVQWNWENGVADGSTFGDAGFLLADLARIGVTPRQEIVTFCQSGVRAAHTFFLLKHLGLEQVRLYDGSWAEWSAKSVAVSRQIEE